jgi:hypothetical protein
MTFASFLGYSQVSVPAAETARQDQSRNKIIPEKKKVKSCKIVIDNIIIQDHFLDMREGDL